MNHPPENVSMALFCDFENVALGVRDAKYERFDIKLVLERLLLKGSIVVKKAYCDWDRYKGFKATMHEANFELIDIPHVRQSGKNSADIRMVVDALDLCYTKSHVNTFVIISGDSDFSPLVSKLRENAKQVIGLGVKQSTSDLLIANCDEFIFYDDLVRETHQAARREPRGAQPANRRPHDEDKSRKDELESRREKGIALAVETFDALLAERGDTGKIWASVLKEAIKRRRPDFNESYYGFRAFGNLLEAAQSRGLLEFGRDEKSGAYVYRASGETAPVEPAAPRSVPVPAPAPAIEPAEVPAGETPAPRADKRRNTRSAGKSASRRARPEAEAAGDTARQEPATTLPLVAAEPAARPAPVAPTPEPVQPPAAETTGTGGADAADTPAGAPAKKAARKTARKTPARPRARKTAAKAQEG
ncbi:NYN domain-containing protein [Pigmentiphaga sp. GD03639]|uniref:NYN domain-containing protein n=1 Tax=Pigmentiphaga sp. GD03639 TaxID=2975354 RepID=UPI002449A2C4|nr:NYN domain-containing protein [Pigmentiphaga sp. GD03639]MDH2235295.1 NYN domain-containing protein [Pigmentiphaga sp. GD03639]